MPIRTVTQTSARTVHHTGALTLPRPEPVTAFDVRLRRAGEPGCPPDALDRSQPGRMRGLARAYLRLWKLEALLDTAELLVSELVTNAFQHGHGAMVGVRLSRTDACVRIEVSGDGGSAAQPAPLVPRRAGVLDEGGRGLFLVSALADAWGAAPDGALVWCELATPRYG